MTGVKQRRKNTVAQAKNGMRRTVNEILDPGPRTVDPLWDYFESRCAYCGIELDRASREGHVDHAETDGGNHLGNLVLACGACNGDEKREASWEQFLLEKADPSAFASRSQRILIWFQQNARPSIPSTPQIENVRAEIDQLISLFGAKCAELRKLVEQQ